MAGLFFEEYEVGAVYTTPGRTITEADVVNYAGVSGDYNVVHTRTVYQLTKSLSVRGILDYNHFYREVFGSLLASYVLRPGTVFFVGFDSNYDKPAPGPYARRDYSVFVKFSYWWRI